MHTTGKLLPVFSLKWCMAYIGNFCQYVLDWNQVKKKYTYEYHKHCAFRKA